MTAFLPLYMMISAGFGFFAGEAIGDYNRHRKCLEQDNESLRAELEKARTCEEPLHCELKRQRGIINDIHKRLIAVSKGVEKQAS